MNCPALRACSAALSVILALAAGPALAGLDFTLPQLPYDRQSSGAAAPAPEPELRNKSELPGLQIAPGVSVSPDFDASSPNAIVDPANPRRFPEPLLRLQVPIPP
jgi:hypothetical protein